VVGRGPSEQVRVYRFPVPSDDESDDDAPGFGAPLPPDDRLWRHPSELGPAGDAAGGGATGGSTGTATAKRSGPNLWGVAVVAGLVGAALSLGVVVTMGGLRDHVVEKPVVEKVPVRAMAEYASSTPNPVVGVTRTIGPAVARLDVATATGATAGSGVLFRDDGYLVTDAHLVQQAKTVQVTLADGRSAPGTILGVDKWTSVAVVKIDTGQVPVATFGSATDLQLGESAIAIGAPIGTSGGPSVTAGVVSALGKKVDSIEGADLHDMIETDAASASTSPGGALANADGVVVGLLTTATPADSPAGMGFAAPIDVVRAVAEDIIATGAAHHAWFGVEGADTDGGARVTKVVDGSPAATAGLSADDVIAAVDGTKITSMSALSVELHGHHSGDTITLVVARAGQDLTMTATLAERTPS
jgi:serine protease Do